MVHRRLTGGLLAALALAVIGAPQAGAAQTEYFLKIATIEGESQAKGHEGEIVVGSFSWGLKNSGWQHARGGDSKLDVEHLAVTKPVDKATPLLMLAVARGQHFPCAVLTARTAGAKRVEYLKIEMEDIIISSYQTGGSQDGLDGSGGGPIASDSIALHPKKVRFEHGVQTRGGAPQRTDAAWDFSAHDQFSTRSDC